MELHENNLTLVKSRQQLRSKFTLKIMKAIKCLKYGGSENLVLADVEKPLPKNNEVLIEIKATSVTASDVLIRRLDEPLIPKFILQLIFGFGKPRNTILGMVSSGVVVAKGENP